MAGLAANRRRQNASARTTALGPLPHAFLAAEESTELWFHAEHVEEVDGHRYTAQALGLTAPAQQVVADPIEREVSGERRERPRPLPHVQHVTDLRGLRREPAAGELVIHARRSGSSNGNGRRRSVLTTLKTVTLAPMPRPARATTNSVKVASRRSVRTL